MNVFTRSVRSPGKLLDGEHKVGRVIARPFLGTVADNFTRTENRHDYAVPPPNENLLPLLKAEGLDVVCIGKIASIYDIVGVTEDLTAKNNEQTVDQTIRALRDETAGLIFSNLVDFDMLYGHRRDTEGYAAALSRSDKRLPEIIAAMNEDDLLMMTADHGNDPTKGGSDHTRGIPPLLVYGKSAKPGAVGALDLSYTGATVTYLLAGIAMSTAGVGAWRAMNDQPGVSLVTDYHVLRRRRRAS